MSATTRMASTADLPVLSEMDRHVTRDVLANSISEGHITISEVDGEVVGCLRWNLFWDEIPFMNLLWVVPERRSQGIGRTLVTAWEKSQAAAGHRLVLTSTVSSESAQHFYRRLGYEDAGALLLPDEAAELFFRKTLTN